MLPWNFPILVTSRFFVHFIWVRFHWDDTQCLWSPFLPSSTLCLHFHFEKIIYSSVLSWKVSPSVMSVFFFSKSINPILLRLSFSPLELLSFTFIVLQFFSMILKHVGICVLMTAGSCGGQRHQISGSWSYKSLLATLAGAKNKNWVLWKYKKCS